MNECLPRAAHLYVVGAWLPVSAIYLCQSEAVKQCPV
jgi:hypothetical protein